jgi:formylglycine-generating enzyme required for sulfatase activity
MPFRKSARDISRTSPNRFGGVHGRPRIDVAAGDMENDLFKGDIAVRGMGLAFRVAYLAAVTCLGFAGLACMGMTPAHADNRVALVIGNGAYLHVPHLPNPSHDAEDVAAALKRTGFQTIVGKDLDQTGMQDAAIKFARLARTADVAVFYYSGHAMQYAGVNYLLPIDAQLHDETDLRRMARVDEIVGDLQQAKNLRILVLDSCRDNPLADELKSSIGQARSAGIGRGLARMQSPDGTIISYSTQAGRTANDGDGRNSPYTSAFLRHIEDKDDIATVFHRISANVYESTKGTQVPELSLSYFGEFYLNGKAQTSVAPAVTAAPLDPCSMAGDHWKSAETINTRGAFEDHLARFPNCAFAGLARARIEALNGKVAVAAAPPPPATLPAPSGTEPPGILGRLFGSSAEKSPTPGSPLKSPPSAQQALVAPPVVPPVSAACDSNSVVVSMSTRAACPLSAAQEHALKPKDSFKECTNCPEMVVVPAGSFTMGSPARETGHDSFEAPQHRVTIDKAFAAGRFSVTFDEWDACVAGGGCNGYKPDDASWGRGWQPVINVSWNDAKAYVAWLSRVSGKPYRLLSEAEREYVARAGTTTPFWWGSSIIPQQANYDVTKDFQNDGPTTYRYGVNHDRTLPVYSFDPNPWGLYQIHGNVYEWIEDCWHVSYAGAPANGSAWTTGCDGTAMLRGGDWSVGRWMLRAAARSHWNSNDDRGRTVGFRLARTLSQ